MKAHLGAAAFRKGAPRVSGPLGNPNLAPLGALPGRGVGADVMGMDANSVPLGKREPVASREGTPAPEVGRGRGERSGERSAGRSLSGGTGVCREETGPRRQRQGLQLGRGERRWVKIEQSGAPEMESLAAQPPAPSGVGRSP